MTEDLILLIPDGMETLHKGFLLPYNGTEGEGVNSCSSGLFLSQGCTSCIGYINGHIVVSVHLLQVCTDSHQQKALQRHGDDPRALSSASGGTFNTNFVLTTAQGMRIAFIGGSMQTKDSSKRGQSFLEELRSLDLPDVPAYHVDAGYAAEDGERAVLRMLSGLEPKHWPTGIVAFNDTVALGAIKQLKQMGLHLPDDMAIIGCDNQFFCPYTDPPLTSVDLHPEELAISAVRELLIARAATARPFSIMRESTLIIRESCGSALGHRKLD